jgi:hypothetical protein
LSVLPLTVNQVCRFKAAGQQAAHDLVREKLHAAVRVVDNEHSRVPSSL